jgi:hypothetical protein
VSETRLQLGGRALTGRDVYRGIREAINNCRARGIEPKTVWVGQDIADALHALWTAVAASYDLRLPPGVAGVPMRVGSGMGRYKFMFEYEEDADKAHELRRQVVRNPLPDND